MSNVFLFFHVFSASIFSCMFVSLGQFFIPQQRKLMGSSAQNSSGVDGDSSEGSREGSGEGPGQGSGEGSRKPWCKAKSGPTGFQRRCPEKVPEALGAEPGQVQHDSGKFRRSGRLWCRARSGSTFFGTFSETLLNLTWLCTKASQAFSGTH